MKPNFLLLLLLLVWLAGLTGGAQAQRPAQNELFQAVELEASQRLPNDMHLAKRYQAVRINQKLLKEIQPGQTIQATAFLDRPCNVRIEVRENYANGMVSLRGRIPDQPESLFALTTCGDAAALSLCTPFQPEITLRYVQSGVHLVCERTPMPRDFCATEGNKEPVITSIPGGNIGVQDINTIDILLFVTPQARANWGGSNAARAAAVNTINYTNGVHTRSSTNAQLRALNVLELSVDESGSYSSVLGRFASNATALNERNRYQADLCALFISRTDAGTNGIGHLPPTGSGNSSAAFSVNYYGDADWVTAHETGHNLGCGHAPNDPTHGGVFSYSNGHNHGDGFFLWLHTVMAYNRGAIAEFRMPYYSQPGVYYESSPGVTWETGTADRNNARTVREMGGAISGYRNVTNNVYVHPTITWVTSNGSEGAPVTQVLTGIDLVSAGGNVHIAGPFNYNQTFSRNKSLNLLLWNGTNPPVNIGRP
jgi:hypothetical protein